MASPGFHIKIGFVGRLREQLLAVADRVRPAVLSEWRGIVLDVFNRSQRNVSGTIIHVRTGHLRRSGAWDVHSTVTGVEGSVGYRATYAEALEKGTRPHVIRPRRAKALRFMGRDGRPVFRASVRHPGLRPRPFLEPAVTDVQPTVKARLTKIILQTINDA